MWHGSGLEQVWFRSCSSEVIQLRFRFGSGLARLGSKIVQIRFRCGPGLTRHCSKLIRFRFGSGVVRLGSKARFGADELRFALARLGSKVLQIWFRFGLGSAV